MTSSSFSILDSYERSAIVRALLIGALVVLIRAGWRIAATDDLSAETTFSVSVVAVMVGLASLLKLGRISVAGIGIGGYLVAAGALAGRLIPAALAGDEAGSSPSMPPPRS